MTDRVWDVGQLVRPEWGPMRHVHAGWDALDDDERAVVAARLDDVLSRTRIPPTVPQAAALQFFAFLAQVETIAIEIPLRFLPHAKHAVRPALRRQLVDEVFHSILFSRIAHDLARPGANPPPPLASAERLLESIRTQDDLGITATLLNLVAEGWIEMLFRHARKWGVADPVFQAVLEDEARHVHEATDYTDDLDLDKARPALADLERGLVEVGAEPVVGLAMMQLAGVDGYRALVADLHKSHVRHLAQVGLEPGAEWQDATAMLEEGMADAAHPEAAPQLLEDTVWRQAARHVWTSPRDPTMKGDFTVPVGRFPRKLTTPVFVAAVGRAWAQNPDLNVVIAQGKRWRLPKVQVGVRVMVAPNELATVVIAEADRRSIRDISRMLDDGVQQLHRMRKKRPAPGEWPEDLRPHLDPQMMEWMPPGPLNFAVSISNVGRFGLDGGSGCFTGNYSPSTDLTIGERHRRPVWRGVAYLPAAHVRVGALQDHRVFDGHEAGIAMSAVRQQFTRANIKRILTAPDTMPDEFPDPDEAERLVTHAPRGLEILPVMGFVKYSPVVVGGAIALGGAAVGVGGYLLYKSLENAGVAAAGGAAGAAAAGSVHPSDPAGQGEHATQTCHGIEDDGSPCLAPAVPGTVVCERHGP